LFDRHSISFKKIAHAAEQMRLDVDAARQRWRASQDGLNPARLVFIDETGTTTNIARVRGHSERGARLVRAIPHGHWKITTLVAGLRHDGLTAPFVIDRPMNGAIFVGDVEQCPAPTLSPGDIVVMDDRAPLCQAQSAVAQSRRTLDQRAMDPNRRAARPIFRRRMPALSRSRRIRLIGKRSCSSAR
jgi:hypothetical protein